MQTGFVNIIKPTGMTSSDVVVKVRGILKHTFGEREKVGHLGTLDPGGAGVLPIAIGRATRLFDYAQNTHKIYRAGFCFGAETDTLDSFGTITKKSEKIPKLNEIIDIIPNFIGKIVQIPPNYSSISIDGKRAYDLSREGKEFVIEGREIEVYSISFVEKLGNSFVFDIDCSGGTYIRSLVRDIATALNTVGYMSFIIRLQAGCFRIEDAITIDEFQQSPSKYITPIESFLQGFQIYYVPDVIADKVLNGVKIKMNNLPNNPFLVYVKGELLGIGNNDDGILNVVTRLI